MSKNITKIILITIIFSVSSIGCAKKPSGDDRVLATVSSKTITLGQFKSKISRLPAYYQNIIEKDKKKYLDETILEMLLYEEAIRKGVDRDREVDSILKEAKKKIVTAKFVKTEIEDKVKVSEDEMKRFYEANREQFKTEPMWRASHILIANQKEAEDLLVELAGGADFAELARVHSIDATSSRGGDVGFFRKGQLIPEFESECLKLQIGEMSGIVHTQFGYHIIKLTDVKEAGAQSFEQAKKAIEAELKRRKRAELFNKMVSDLRNKYSVNIKEDLFESLSGAKKGPVSK